jgi:hypothetical protein
VHSRKILALVEGRAALVLAKRVAKSAGLVVEEVGVVGGGQALEKGSNGRGKTVVDFVSRGPELKRY